MRAITPRGGGNLRAVVRSPVGVREKKRNDDEKCGTRKLAGVIAESRSGADGSFTFFKSGENNKEQERNKIESAALLRRLRLISLF